MNSLPSCHPYWVKKQKTDLHILSSPNWRARKKKKIKKIRRTEIIGAYCYCYLCHIFNITTSGLPLQPVASWISQSSLGNSFYWNCHRQFSCCSHRPVLSSEWTCRCFIYKQKQFSCHKTEQNKAKQQTSPNHNTMVRDKLNHITASWNFHDPRGATPETYHPGRTLLDLFEATTGDAPSWQRNAISVSNLPSHCEINPE